ncbi:MAG: vanadium-dependent haloperoxidase [Saprospiraceae bacterium]|jgi:membrane-associated phospholipid phosphatase|nr:vanadium-dependent haloperoxidase [Saprospiraceae bacterium]
MFKTTKIFALLTVVIMGFLFSCNPDDNKTSTTNGNLVKDTKDHDVINRWNTVMLDLDKTAAGFRPCPIARVAGYIGFATYETAVSGMPGYKSLAKNYSGYNVPAFDASKTINYPLAINAATAYMYKQFFPNDVPNKILPTEEDLRSKYGKGVNQDVIDNSIAWGTAVAKATYDWAKSDVSVHNSNVDATQGGYQVLPGNGIYRTETNYPLTTTAAWFPKYGQGRVFAINGADRIIPPPIAYSEDPKSPYYGQAIEVYTLVKQGTFDDKWLGEFWSDDLLNLTFSPPARWFAVANQVYDIDNSNLEKALFTNAKIGMALNDVVVACWDNKYKYQIERPVAYIRKFIDPDFKSILGGDKGITPPFPAYPSGHSTMGGAAAEVLTADFGIEFPMYDRCHEGRTEFIGRPRFYPNFYLMAEESAYSRVPLGVHWRMDCKAGIDLGYVIGRKVNKLPFK